MDYLQIKPKLKKAYPIVFDEGRIIVGGFGKNTVYEDETGAVTATFKLLNGKHTIAEISDQISKQYSSINPENVLELINDLNHERFIEDSELIGSDILNDYQRERYHRNINFFSSFVELKDNKYELQAKLGNATAGIIGLGGLGSHIVYDLAGLGIGHIKAIEFDKLDLTNLNRQILYNYSDIGKSKGQLAKQRIHDFNPEIKFDLLEQQISETKQIIEFFKDVDFIILVADRPKYLMARWANEAAVNLNVPMFCAGLEAQRAMYYTVVPHKTGCVNCWQESVKEQDNISTLVLKEKERLNLLGDNTAIVPLVSVVTGMINAEIIRYITKIGELQAAGNLIAIDFLTMRTSVIEQWQLADDCPICGGKKVAHE
jgi:molybdopterin/thiamine biosynthesis adenylyltransferase